MPRYAGKNLRMYLSTSGTGNASPVEAISAFTIDRTADRYDVTAGGDGNVVEVQGYFRYEATFEGAWTDTETKLALAAASADGARAYLYPDALNAPSKYVGMPCWVAYGVSASATDAVRLTSGSLAANGTVGWNV
jgi:hypothetical protein